jgi:protein involved in polysaccharide export with SLBB domain
MRTHELIASAKGLSGLRLIGSVAILIGSQSLPCAAQVPLANGQATSATEQPASAPQPAALTLPSYRVIPGDILDVNVFDKPELSKQILVPPDGKIQYPFVGEFVVANRTLGEIRSKLTTALSKEIVSPQVSVTILRRQVLEVSVLGAVKTPGKRALNDNWRVLDLIVEGGGLIVARPEWATATLVRGGGAQAIPIDLTKLMSGSLDQNLQLAAGDILLVREVEPTKISLEIIGQVNKPGKLVAPPDGSFATIINSVDGFKETASRKKVTLIRDGKSITVDMREVLTTGRVVAEDGTEVKALAGDQIIVGENKLIYAVTGAVGRSGPMQYPETGQVSILSALSMAGGVQANADLKNAVLVRATPGGKPDAQAINLEDFHSKKNIEKNNKDGSKGKPGEAKAGIDLVLQPGDYLYIPAKGPNRQVGVQQAMQSALTGFMLFNAVSN